MTPIVEWLVENFGLPGIVVVAGGFAVWFAVKARMERELKAFETELRLGEEDRRKLRELHDSKRELAAQELMTRAHELGTAILNALRSESEEDAQLFANRIRNEAEGYLKRISEYAPFLDPVHVAKFRDHATFGATFEQRVKRLIRGARRDGVEAGLYHDECLDEHTKYRATQVDFVEPACRNLVGYEEAQRLAVKRNAAG